MAGRGWLARSSAAARARTGRGRASGTQSQAQFVVFVDLAERARARAGANQRAVAAGFAVGGYPPQPVSLAATAAGRTVRAAARVVRRCLAEAGSRAAWRHSAAAAQRTAARA